ncbi:MAG: hypothetical protein IJN75_05015 [Clostridia bacterium]|nr:hypothetical protein [Clostridia bacterium]
MKDIVLLISAFIVVFTALWFFVLKPFLREHRIKNGVQNHDKFRTVFLFRVYCSEKEFLSKLNLENDSDVLKYTFSEKMKKFTMSNTEEYSVLIKEFDGGIYVRLSNNVFGQRTNTRYYINEFMIKKFNAELLPYDEYNDIVK